MKKYITIDGGTTNTRVSLIEDGVSVATKKIARGAKAGIDDRDGLKAALKEAISAILAENGAFENEIIRILASGMITSEFGLCEVPHLSTPVGIEELSASTLEKSFPDISPIPFVFIRGVKADSESLLEFDMMRGEETELMGLISLGYGSSKKEQLFVLPGSHSKLIRIDKREKITAFSTMLTGEMILSLSQNTILKDAVDLSVSEYDEEMLFEGYRFAKAEGLNKSLFKVRILKNRFGRNACQVSSFFMGVVLADEIDCILSQKVCSIAIGGRSQIKTATATLLRRICEKEIIVIPDEAVEASTSAGIIAIYEHC